MAGLTPPRDAPSPPRVSLRRFGLVFAVSLVVASGFWSPFISGGSPNAFDWASHHYHYFDWVRTSFAEHGAVPLYMADAWITPNFLANAESPQMGPLAPLLLVLPTAVYLKVLVVFFAALGLTGTFMLLRDLDVGALIAAPVAFVFAFQGFVVSHVAIGHHWAMGALLLPGLLCLYRRAALGSNAALWLAAAGNAFTIAGGQHQPFIWQNLFLGFVALLWSLRVRDGFPISRLALLWVASFGLGAVKLLPMWIEFRDYDPSVRIPGIPFGVALWSLVARGQEPGTVVEGLEYLHGAAWWEYAFYLGGLAAAILALGIGAARREWPLLLMGCVFVWLSLEWPSSLRALDPWPLLAELPVWRTQRGPSRMLFAGLFALLVAGSLGLQRLSELVPERHSRTAAAVGALLGLVVCVDLFVEGLAWQRASVGEPLASRDHEPRPRKVRGSKQGLAVLEEFSPNRLVYRISSPAGERFVLPVRYGKRELEWDVGGLPARAHRGKLSLDLPPGERNVAMTYRPKLFRAGLALSAATCLALLGQVAWRRQRRG